jgi:hypothetical protein
LHYRLHGQSISQTNGPAQQASAKRACEDAWARRGVTGRFDATDLWRPDGPESNYQFLLKYGWTAWSNGYRATWRSYAIEAIRTRPFDLSSWKLAVIGSIRAPARTPSTDPGLNNS